MKGWNVGGEAKGGDRIALEDLISTSHRHAAGRKNGFLSGLRRGEKASIAGKLQLDEADMETAEEEAPRKRDIEVSRDWGRVAARGECPAIRAPIDISDLPVHSRSIQSPLRLPAGSGHRLSRDAAPRRINI